MLNCAAVQLQHQLAQRARLTFMRLLKRGELAQTHAAIIVNFLINCMQAACRASLHIRSIMAHIAAALEMLLTITYFKSGPRTHLARLMANVHQHWQHRGQRRDPPRKLFANRQAICGARDHFAARQIRLRRKFFHQPPCVSTRCQHASIALNHFNAGAEMRRHICKREIFHAHFKSAGAL